MKQLKTLAAAAALLGLTATAAHAGTVTLSHWAVTAGTWDRSVNMHNVSPGNPTFSRSVSAGGFSGSTSGFNEADVWVKSTAFLTYCVEFTQSFSFSNSGMADYSLVSGGSYGQWGSASSAISARLGGLMTYVGSLTGGAAVDSREESAAVQLAIWEIIYQTPVGEVLALDSGNLYENGGSNVGLRKLANSLLASSTNTQSQYDVFVLTNDGSQDFIALRPQPGRSDETVPEPGAMGLSLAALGALSIASRRRRRG